MHHKIHLRIVTQLHVLYMNSCTGWTEAGAVAVAPDFEEFML
jgi:hypothetical protein